MASNGNDPLNRANLGLLPEEKGRFGSFGVSTVINLVAAGILILLTMAQIHQEQKRRQYQTTELIFPVEQPKPYVPPAPKIHIIPPPPKIEQPKITLPKPQPEPPKPVAVKVPTPEMPKLEPAPPKAVTPPPQPKVGLFKSAVPTRVANNNSAPTPKTGGFGDPNGVTPNPHATRPATIAAVGAFAAAPGPANGAGAARQGAVHGTDFGSGVANGVPGGKDRGTVASAGFKSGVVGGTGAPGSHGTVATGGFQTPVGTGNGEQHLAKMQEPQSTPIVVVSKPLPQYTPEARQLRIQGDVTLEVRFTASGRVEVLRVVSGLGHGLDQQAILAAEKIRFKPATKNGIPVDEVSTIRITFQLA
ncbi:energy transducer TonB [Pseudacidobacterium ailaaui]|jgi:TonB family protein|uniref:energy transducer TonB n=1 Tax=Pseudacidobacterium ailaaui TaxID=1382359 RepID=UPI00047E981A|nr:energy transducer TonB [Pseudacidobacterium ailaaui]MBX6360259.1 energy transducer TonB [Pseudacidobacterium ailaaui]MDI3253738.1 energy transducer TonB [Bacillota bacterium]